MKTPPHQYVDRKTGRVRTEEPCCDRLVRFLYSRVRENAPALFRALTSRRASKVLSQAYCDSFLNRSRLGARRLVRNLGIDLGECLDPPEDFDSVRKVLERKIRYWDCRPMPLEEEFVVSPADARVLVGSLQKASQLHIKDKFFRLNELLGANAKNSIRAFQDGDVAVFRLTPEKYHYTHMPVTGHVLDVYEVDGAHHSSHPQASIILVTPYSKNRRVVTLLDTDIAGGTGVGIVAMVEVVALFFGEVVQRYSERRYDDSREVRVGMVLRRGSPKSLFRPGSSTVVLLFQRDRIRFAPDLVSNLHVRAESLFSQGFGRPLVETDVTVRSWIGTRDRRVE